MSVATLWAATYCCHSIPTPAHVPGSCASKWPHGLHLWCGRAMPSVAMKRRVQKGRATMLRMAERRGGKGLQNSLLPDDLLSKQSTSIWFKQLSHQHPAIYKAFLTNVPAKPPHGLARTFIRHLIKGLQRIPCLLTLYHI